jgi:hypothetical protein
MSSLPPPPPGVLGDPGPSTVAPTTPTGPAAPPAVATVEVAGATPPTRGLTDVHPKVAVATLAGALVTIVLWVLGLTGHALDPGLVGMITTGSAALGGYLTPSGS